MCVRRMLRRPAGLGGCQALSYEDDDVSEASIEMEQYLQATHSSKSSPNSNNNFQVCAHHGPAAAL